MRNGTDGRTIWLFFIPKSGPSDGTRDGLYTRHSGPLGIRWPDLLWPHVPNVHLVPQTSEEQTQGGGELMCCTEIHITEQNVQIEGRLAWLANFLRRHNLVKYNLSVVWVEGEYTYNASSSWLCDRHSLRKGTGMGDTKILLPLFGCDKVHLVYELQPSIL